MEQKEYATTLGALRNVIEAAISVYGEGTPYALFGCYEAEGLVELEFLLESGGRRVRLFTDLCSG